MSLACVSRVFFIGCLLAILAACGGDEVSPQQQLKTAIASIADAVESGDRDRVGDWLHPDYHDPRHPDRRAALATLFWYQRQHQQIHLFTLVRDIEIDATTEQARTSVMVAMTGVPVDSVEALVSLKADLYHFGVEWQFNGDEWQVVSSRWERADLSSLTSG
jgi:hypothetical protein